MPRAAFTSVAGTRPQLTDAGPAAAAAAVAVVAVTDWGALEDPELPHPASRKAEARTKMPGRVICMGR